MKRIVFTIITASALLLCLDTFSQNRRFEIVDWEKGINKRQPPEIVMDAIGFKPGMIVGEVGAGTGRMTLWIAERIGPEGKVYANDIDIGGLDQIRKRAKMADIRNIETIIGDITDPKLPENKLDIVFMINVFHHLDDPLTILKNIRPSLKQDGYLAIVDCDPDKVSWGKSHGCTGKQEMTEILLSAGYTIIKIPDVLKEDGIYLAKPIR